MKTLLLSALSALIALLSACTTVRDAPAEARAPSAVGDRVMALLSQYRTQSFRGLPNGTQANVLAPHLSPRLNALLRDARTGQQAYKARFPTDKPPMIEGDIFSSLFEGASTGQINTVEVADGRATVGVDYSYVDPDSRQVITAWQDQFLLIRAGSVWLIDDVEYRGGWDFAPRGRLSAALIETASWFR